MFNADFPLTYCKVRDEFLYDLTRGHGDYTDGCIFGVTAIEGRALGFHVQLENGAQFARLPLHALCTKPCPPVSLGEVMLWDCLSSDIEVWQSRYLKDLDCDVWLGKKGLVGGSYVATVDYKGEGYAEMPDQHKVQHIIRLDSGHLAAQPNNRIRWQEPSWIKPFDGKPEYRVQTTKWYAEREARILDPDKQFYTMEGDV